MIIMITLASFYSYTRLISFEYLIEKETNKQSKLFLSLWYCIQIENNYIYFIRSSIDEHFISYANILVKFSGMTS